MNDRLVLLGVLGAVLASTACLSDENPYSGIYIRSMEQMGKADSLLIASADSADGASAPILLAGSKTCSQRCSTRCSVSCTTSRGCSTQCKVQTEGCANTQENTPTPVRSTPSTTIPPSVTRLQQSQPESAGTATKAPPAGTTISGKAASIVSGDTLYVRQADGTQLKVFLASTAAPANGESQFSLSKAALADKVLDKDVSVRVISADTQGRVVGVITCGNTCVNTEMVKEGWARYNKYHQESQTLAEAEAAAKNAKIGIWAEQGDAFGSGTGK